MSRSLKATIAVLLAVSAVSTGRAADYDYPVRDLPPPVVLDNTNVQPIILLLAFWSEVRKSGTVQEVVERVRGRFGPGPITFQGTSGLNSVPTQITILRIYQREEDALIQLPAVSIDIATSRAGSPSGVRKIVVPLYPLTSSAYR